MNEYKKLGKNTIYLTIGSFSSKILSFLFVPLYTIVLSTAEFGISDLMITTVNLISPIFTLLISEAVMRFALENNSNKSQVFSAGMLTSIIGFFCMMVFSPLILLNESLKPYYWLFVLYYLTSTIANFLLQFTKGIERIQLYTVSGICNTIIIISLNVIFLFVLRLGIVGYILSIIISNLLISIYLFTGAKMHNYLIKVKEIDITFLKEMYRYSIPMIPNSISWWISDSSDKYLVTVFCGVATTGIYSVAYKIPTLLTVIAVIFMSAWQISAVDGFGSEKTRLFYSDIYQKYSSINILLTSGIIVFCKIIAHFLFSNDFFAAWLFTPILVFAYLFNTMAAFLGTIYTSAKKTKMLFYSTIVGAILNIIVNLLLIPLFGGVGAAIATCISYFVVWFIRIINSRNIMKLDINYKKDIICYIIIVFQTIIICFDIKYAFVYTMVMFLAIVIMECRFLKQFIRLIRVIIGSRILHLPRNPGL